MTRARHGGVCSGGVRALHIGAAEAVTHLQRAVALWDRVTDPEDTRRSVKPDASAAPGKRPMPGERGARTLRDLHPRGGRRDRAPTGPMVASRAYATFTRCQPQRRHGRRRGSDSSGSEYAGTTPSPERAHALCSQSAYHHRRGHGTPALRLAEHAAHVAQEAGDPEREVEALHFCAIELDLLGRVGQAVAARGKRCGWHGTRADSATPCSWSRTWRGSNLGGAGERLYERASQALKRACERAARPWGLLRGRGLRPRSCGKDASMTPPISDRLATSMWGPLALARGDSRQESTSPAVTRTRSQGLDRHRGSWRPASTTAGRDDVDGRVTAFLGLERTGRGTELAESYLSFVEGGDSPVRHAAAAFTAYRASGWIPRDELRPMRRSLARVRPGSPMSGGRRCTASDSDG